ncbi:LIM domain-containing protein [Draconibacterium sp. IB214405]|uniref:LIM domain-containing protein n=1 Tax=Draconibacterium sp. IB214405 TaxID=3097352 RepID=UPI002A14B6BD|nr:LIM domain-containing protein [Draconibacterium sp. IB214405]MDX8337975.1 LIM domain-containing protein [Draconibacterium sp. IB214405]
MGHAYLYRCDHCGFTESFNQGHGFLVHSQEVSDYLGQRTRIFHYKTHNLLKALVQTSNNPHLKAGFQIYKCPKCKTLFDKIEVTVYENEKVIHKSEFRCKDCRSRLKLTNIHRLKKAICPRCKKRTFHRDTVQHQLWD